MMSAQPINGSRLEAMTAESASKVTNTKRKTAPKEDEDEDEDGSGSDGDSDVSMINVDFDFFNLNTDVDQMAVKRLLRQTLSHDEEMIEVHSLAELILSEGVRLAAGSSIKTDGEESDPWGLVGVVDIERHRENPALRPFIEYLLSGLPARNPIRMLLEPSQSPAMASRPALVFSLRLLNLPLPLIPPLYKMLMSELAEGAEEKQGRGFTHWLLWGRGYRLEGTEEGMGLDMQVDGEEKMGKKKRKGAAKVAATLQSGSFPYHPEEEYIDKVATYVHEYPFKTAAPRDSDAFGVEQFGRLVLVDKAKLGQAVQAMEAAA